MPDIDPDKHLVFISYTRADRDRVSAYYSALQFGAYRLWMDVHDIKGGQNWDFEISRAMDKSSIVIAFLSKHSVDRRGYVQRELKIALDKLQEKLIDDIYLIPVLLDDVPIPDLIKAVHVLTSQDEDVAGKIKASVLEQISRLDDAVIKIQENSGLTWSFSVYKDAWEGLPGYDARYQIVRFSSIEQPRVEEISHVIRGVLSIDLMSARSVMFRQDASSLNFGKGKFWRTNTYDATCTRVSIVERIISVEYAIHTFGAGAAHGMTYFKTFNFIAYPTIFLKDLATIFASPDVSLAALQQLTREQLAKISFEVGEDAPFRLEKDWISKGTESWEDLSAFVFVEEGLSITFCALSSRSLRIWPSTHHVEVAADQALHEGIYTLLRRSRI